MSIQVKNISKHFHEFTVLDNVNLEVKSGELVALLGPSGSGKTTLLRIISGLEFADSGSILLEGKEAHTKHAKERNVGFVFQHYALFKHMTVFENVAFGLNMRRKKLGLSQADIKQKVTDLLHLVHLEAFYDHYPAELSGGQRQRVALIRALAVGPKVLLLDEPFGALDAKVRKELRRWMRKLHDEIQVTSIFVTHDQDEAMEVADRVVVMHEGKIKQVGTPEEIWDHPIDRFVYDFLSNYNEFKGWKDENGEIHLVEDSKMKIPENVKLVNLYARPHEMYITKEPDDKQYVVAKVVHINPTGSLVKVELERKNKMIMQVEITRDVFENLQIKKGDLLYVRPTQTKIFES